MHTTKSTSVYISANHGNIPHNVKKLFLMHNNLLKEKSKALLHEKYIVLTRSKRFEK
jgi:hypothetical protein